MIEHEKFIQRCFELAERGFGLVSPNPLVGSVIVKEGRIISEGYHKKFGMPHAEAEAINNCDADLSNATLYCNLEPCSHIDKKTPPCVPLIISSGINKVVISNIDPNPKVAGRGIKQLKEAGVEVITGVLAKEGEYLNRFFFKHIQSKIPFVTLKIAQSIDGFISKSKNEQTWLTGNESKKYVHGLRTQFDAVLVGANTVRVDDPLLNVRVIEGRNPAVIIIDGRLSISGNSKLFEIKDRNVIIFTSSKTDGERKFYFKDLGAEIIEMETDSDFKIDLLQILKEIGSRNLNSVLVEGGAEIFSTFINQNIFDELITITAPKLIGSGLSAFYNSGEIKLKLQNHFTVNDDSVSIYLNAEPNF